MKKKSCLINVALTGVLGVYLLVCVLVKSLFPGVILPELDIPHITLISLVTLLTAYYFTPDSKWNYSLIFVFSAVSYALLPAAAGITGPGSGGSWHWPVVSCLPEPPGFLTLSPGEFLPETDQKFLW